MVEMIDNMCNSWVIIDNATDSAIVEVWNTAENRATLSRISKARYTVMTTYNYLCMVNRKIIKENNQ